MVEKEFVQKSMVWAVVDRHISVSLTLDHRPHMYSQDTRCQAISPILLYQQLV